MYIILTLLRYVWNWDHYTPHCKQCIPNSPEQGEQVMRSMRSFYMLLEIISKTIWLRALSKAKAVKQSSTESWILSGLSESSKIHYKIYGQKWKTTQNWTILGNCNIYFFVIIYPCYQKFISGGRPGTRLWPYSILRFP